MALSDLEARYLDIHPGGPPVYRANTEIRVLIDGAAIFTAIHEALQAAAGPGDAIYLTAWQMDAAWCLHTGQRSALSDPESLAQMLLRKAGDGVDVRVLFSGSRLVCWSKIGPFRGNLVTAHLLQAMRDNDRTDPPLARSVLCDWSGATYTGSQHQKSVVIKAGDGLAAFVGGIDLLPDYWDFPPHAACRQPPAPQLRWPDGSPWGWHDVALQLRGGAACGVWQNFRQRWSEARTLPDNDGLSSQRVRGRTRNSASKPTPAPSGVPMPDVVSRQSIQILRSRFKYKIPHLLPGGGRSWQLPEPGGIYEVWSVLRKAVAGAERYIYLEDQFLRNSPHLEWIPARGYCLFAEIGKALVANPDLRVVFVGSGKSDPRDIIPAQRNRRLTGSIRRKLLKPLREDDRGRVAVWRVEDVTVHSKLLLIDDEFVAIGSANAHSRSMYGIDSELHVAVVAEDTFVQQLRCELWAEHWQLKPFQSAEVQQALTDLDTALGLWCPAWSGDPLLWRTSDRPVGYTFPRGRTGRGALVPVGPHALH